MEKEENMLFIKPLILCGGFGLVKDAGSLRMEGRPTVTLAQLETIISNVPAVISDSTLSLQSPAKYPIS